MLHTVSTVTTFGPSHHAAYQYSYVTTRLRLRCRLRYLLRVVVVQVLIRFRRIFLIFLSATCAKELVTVNFVIKWRIIRTSCTRSSYYVNVCLSVPTKDESLFVPLLCTSVLRVLCYVWINDSFPQQQQIFQFPESPSLLPKKRDWRLELFY